jgi:hypothetical protein
MNEKINRRGFISGCLLASATLPGFISLEEQALLNHQDHPTPRKYFKSRVSKKDMPTGKLGKLKLSRILGGGNIISGWCHQRDLLYVSKLAQAYLTKEKQQDTLEIMESSGINGIIIDMIQMEIINNYNKDRGGKMKTIVGVREDWGAWQKGDWDKLKVEIDKTIDMGADTMYLHGGYCDRMVEAERTENVELIGRGLEYIHDKGYEAGLGSHSIYVPMDCDKQGIEPDYYVKTFHHDNYWSATPKDKRKKFCVDGKKHLDHNEFHDNIYCLEPEKTAEYMKSKKQPWVAFKVLAAGAIPPESAFKYAFENGVDFVSIGMFDFEVEDNAQTTVDILKDLDGRERPWRA